MASEILSIHSKTPEIRKIRKVAEALRNGAVILYPADTGFMLGCELSNRDAIDRIRTIRRLPPHKEMTFLCDSLSNISEFGKVSNLAYKTLKRLIPGPFTFILPATKLVPKFAQDSQRKTAGIRVPDNDLSQLLLIELGMPLISISAKFPDTGSSQSPDEVLNSYYKLVDVAVNSDEYHFVGESTIIDMTTDEFKVLRHGAGIAKVIEYVEMNED